MDDDDMDDDFCEFGDEHIAAVLWRYDKVVLSVQRRQY